MANIYDLRRYGKLIFLVSAMAVVGVFLYLSHGLVRDLAERERERMEIWADATKELVNSTTMPETMDDGAEAFQPMGTDIDFLLKIIQGNTTIPVLLTDDAGNILQSRNFDLPVPPPDSIAIPEPNEVNDAFLREKLAQLSKTENVIRIEIAPCVHQYLYYEDSTLLKRLNYYPYVQVLVMLVFIAVVYFAVLSTKKAEQNKVWVGLSKETAHQLGTPISSLMAWIELLRDMGVDPDTIDGMNMDVTRLSTIASRFSKIGSVPNMEPTDLGTLIDDAVRYMRGRISPRITLTYHNEGSGAVAMASAPLLEWVIENLIKNAVDAMDGKGDITVRTWEDPSRRMAVVEVRDTGKGIPRKNFKTVFNPGYTTKSRGWGLGLTLAKRIIEEYHRGHIYVHASAPDQGTTFRIDLPLA